jgi:hypothetical protein
MRKRIDKCWKLCSGHLAARTHNLNFNLVFQLDADDLIHRDLVKHVMESPSSPGWQMRLGYELDHMSKRLYPTDRIHQICGSTFMVSRETALRPAYDGDPFFNSIFIVHGHHTIQEYWSEQKLSVRGVPFRSVLYRVNNSASIRGDRYGRVGATLKRFAKFHVFGRAMNEEDRLLFGPKVSGKHPGIHLRDAQRLSCGGPR